MATERSSPTSRSLQRDLRLAQRLLRSVLERAGGPAREARLEARRSVDKTVALAAENPASGLPTGALVVARSGRWFRPATGDVVKLHRRHALRRIVVALAEARELTPGAPLTLAHVVEAGWPGERIAARAAADRAYAAIATLRRMGLRDTLVRLDDGYAFEPQSTLWLVDDRPE